MSDSVTDFVPKDVLDMYGCRHCCLLDYGLCSYADKDPSGCCDDMVRILLSLGATSKGFNLSVMKEKYHLYVQEMQEQCDRTDFLKTKREYEKLRSEGCSDHKRLNQLNMQMQSYRMWWQSLTSNLVKGYQRINDREVKSDQSVTHTHKIDLSQMHSLMHKAKQLEDKKDES